MVVFLPLLMELLPALVGEGGLLSGLVGRAGLSEGLAGQAGKKAVAQSAAEHAGKTAWESIPKSENLKNLGSMSTQQFMSHWMKREGIQTSAQSHMADIASQIHGGGSGGGNKPPQTGATAANAPQPGQPNQTQSLQNQKKQNELQHESIRNQQKENQLFGQWLPTVQKWLFAANNLIFAFQSLKSAMSGRSDNDRRSFFKLGLDVLRSPITETSKWFYNIYKNLIKTEVALTKFSAGISEGNRELSNWNGRLAASFAQLDFRRQGLQIQQGFVTSGSGSLLNDKLGDLLTELQPLTNAIVSATNLAAVGATYLARGLVFLAKLNPVVAGLLGVLNDIEKGLQKRPNIAGDDFGRAGLRDLRRLAPANRPGEFPPNLIPGPKGNLPPLKK